jgi:two-component system chemotaxis sensor kinase CheA
MNIEALRQSLLAKFREVGADRLERIGLSLVALERDGGASGPEADDLARELHTMKGEARMLALPRIGELAHAAEDLLKAARDGRAPLSSATDLLLQACDAIAELLDDLPSAQAPNERARGLLEALTRASGAPAPGPPAPAAMQASSVPAALPEPGRPEAPLKAESGRSIRVAVDALDQLGALVGDLLVEGARADLRNQELGALIARINRMGDRLLALGERLAVLAPGEAAGLERLEGDLHLLRDDTFLFARRNADGVNALQGHLARLTDAVAESRLVPLSSVFSAFPRQVRDLARDQGKEIEVEVTNAEVGVDRGILGEVRDAMVHLLRNAVDHGIEGPRERAEAGKPTKGRIAIEVRASGGMLAVDVVDDGRGMDPARLRERAAASSLVSAARAAALGDREALELIFLPGFSTREEVTEISGRGVGMGVVKQKVESLGGAVSVWSQPGRGARISLRLPQSMALMRVLLVYLGRAVYGIPAADVQAVGRVRGPDRTTLGGREAVEFRGKPSAFVELGPLLRLPGAPRREASPCVFVKHGEDRAALAVDGFLGAREVAVKPCGGEFLKGAPFVAGAAALEDGRVAVLLNVPDVLQEIRRAGGRAPAEPRPARRLRLLLVDDSPIARATEGALARALGHQVDEASDARDALRMSAEGRYDAVVTDIQMPGMDGFELTRRLKAGPATASLPVVVLSSLASPEDRRRGLDAGADAYLLKGELSAEALAQTLDRFT